MSKLFKREAIVTVGTLRVSGLRTQFRIEKTGQPEPNKLTLSLTNLSPDSRGKLTDQAESSGVAVIFEAGYAGTKQSPATTEIIFTGTARLVSHSRQGPDWVTKIQSGDGVQAYKSARFVGSFAPGSKRATLAEEAAKKLGLPLGNLKERLKAHDFTGALTEFVNGFAAAGNAAEQLTELLAPVGLGWSIQDGQIQVLSDDETTAAQAVLLAPTSGLIGSPEIGEKGVVKLKSLLQPGLRPGRKIEVRASAVKGFFRADRVVHVGDTHGAEWYSEVEARRLPGA